MHCAHCIVINNVYIEKETFLSMLLKNKSYSLFVFDITSKLLLIDYQ